MKKPLLCLSCALLLSSFVVAEPKFGRGYFKKRYATPEPGIEMLVLSLGAVASSLLLKNRLGRDT